MGESSGWVGGWVRRRTDGVTLVDDKGGKAVVDDGDVLDPLEVEGHRGALVQHACVDEGVGG